MWLTKRTVYKNEEEKADIGTVTIGGESPGVMTVREERDIPVCSGGGYIWRPKAGDRVVVIKCEDGTAAVMGKMETEPVNMKNGEVYIKSDKAFVHLKNSGEIEVSGTVNISGVVNIIGGLIVNGNAVG